MVNPFTTGTGKRHLLDVLKMSFNPRNSSDLRPKNRTWNGYQRTLSAQQSDVANWCDHVVVGVTMVTCNWKLKKEVAKLVKSP